MLKVPPLFRHLNPFQPIRRNSAKREAINLQVEKSLIYVVQQQNKSAPDTPV